VPAVLVPILLSKIELFELPTPMPEPLNPLMASPWIVLPLLVESSTSPVTNAGVATLTPGPRNSIGEV